MKNNTAEKLGRIFITRRDSVVKELKKNLAILDAWLNQVENRFGEKYFMSPTVSPFLPAIFSDNISALTVVHDASKTKDPSKTILLVFTHSDGEIPACPLWAYPLAQLFEFKQYILEKLEFFESRPQPKKK